MALSKEERSRRSGLWHKQHPERGRAATRRAYVKHKVKRLAKSAEWRKRMWDEFFGQYGSVCIGTADGIPCRWKVVDRDALTIAHMNADGYLRRIRMGISGKTYRAAGIVALRDLAVRNWPKDEGIATQCANCQMIDARRKASERRIR